MFQDVPSDHAFKTMTMEAFPHSGAQLASVHPCKHASVMKKFIDRMESATQGDNSSGSPSAAEKGGSGGKKKWGLGGMVRRVTGSGDPKREKEVSDGSASDDQPPQGLQVDFYLVIVSHAGQFHPWSRCSHFTSS